ncbi:MAG: S9 family peptidase [Acidobacteria bacterium]|nr:MAG: S9 family peptidase [Acidobacteriota bacterium]
MKLPGFILSLLMVSSMTLAEETSSQTIEKLESINTNLRHRLDRLEKGVDDLIWFQRMKNVAFIDKIYITAPPSPKNFKNKTAMGVNNPIKIWCYVFIPKGIDLKKSYPLIVFPHGGVHSDFSTYYTHIVKELMYQQYIVVAPEYRGSTGYGQWMYERIDYGGLEVEDVFYARNHMTENYHFVDKKRVGIIGWSHGGLITLMNIFEHPEAYQVAFSGVPVSDLISRMGYYTDDYRALYSVDYHIGKTAYENVGEYRRRSPAWNTHKFQNTPLLIHTNTNDDDVNVLEVEHLIKSLKADGKQFEYEIYKDIEGGHSFDRIDTKIGRSIRLKIWKFLARELHPEKPISTMEQMFEASYLQ